MDTITQDKLRAEWDAWVSENNINFLTEYPAAPRSVMMGDFDPRKMRTTAYVVGDVGYKLFRRSIPDLGQKAIAWRFPVPTHSTTRDIFHRASCILEASPVGLEKLFRGAPPEIRADQFRFEFGPVELCEEHFGPPPPHAHYVEVDWRLRRMTQAYAAKQREAYVFGPEHVRRLLAGMRVTGVQFANDVCETLEIRHSMLHDWLHMGTEFVRDDFVMMDRHRRVAPRTNYAKRVKPILDLAAYEKFSPPAGYWTVNEALEQ